MKAFKFMAINYSYFYVFVFGVILFSSCESNNCICEKYAIDMAEITISVKSLYEEDIEIRCVGNYCCSREKGDNDWTIIRKDYAELISNYNKLDNPDANYSKETDSLYKLGFEGLNLVIMNIQNIEYITTVEPIIDSFFKIPDTIRHNAIFFDEYPNNLGLEFREEDGLFIKDITLKKLMIFKLCNLPQNQIKKTFSQTEINRHLK